MSVGDGAAINAGEGLIALYGFDHSPYNVQGVLRFKQVALDSLQSTSGLRINYLENPNLDSLDAGRYINESLEEGFVYQLTRKTLMGQTTYTDDNKIKNRMEALAEVDPETIIRKRLLAPDALQVYSLFKLYDELVELGVNLDSESHKRNVRERSQSLATQATKHILLATSNYKGGNIKKAVGNMRVYSKLITESDLIREMDMNRDLQKITGQSENYAAGLVIFSGLGVAHQEVANGVIAPKGCGILLDIRRTISTPNYPYLNLLTQTRAKQYPSDLLVAHALLCEMMLAEIVERTQLNGRINQCTQNYETITQDIFQEVGGLSWEQIQEYCRRRPQMAYGIVINNLAPLTQSILS